MSARQAGRAKGWVRGALVAAALVLLSACASTDPYAGLTGEPLWEAGVAAYEAEEWSDAITLLQRFATQNPGHPRGPEARMLTALAYMERGEYFSAASEFERFLLLHPSDGMAPDASIGACRAYRELAPIPPRDQTNTRRARDACFETAMEFRGLSVAQEAEEIWFEMMDRLAERAYQDSRFYQRRGLHDSAILYFERVVFEYPDTEWAHRAILGRYRSYQEMGWEAEAEEEAARLFSRYPNSDSARELRDELGIPQATAGDGSFGP